MKNGMRSAGLCLGLLLSFSALATPPPPPGYTGPTPPFPPGPDGGTPTIATVSVSGGMQHRIVVQRNGESRWFYGANNSYFNRINPGRMGAFEKLVEKLEPAQLQLVYGQATCNAPPTTLMVFKKDGRVIEIDSISECKHMTLPGRDERLKDLLLGLLAIGDLHIPE